MTVKNLSFLRINSVNTLCLIINKINGYIAENNGNKNLTLVPTDESKGTLVKGKSTKGTCKGTGKGTNKGT